jgi:hypothetical protein
MVPTREGPGQAFRFERVGAGTWDLVHQTRERVNSVPRTFEVAGDVSLGAIDLPPTLHVRCAVRFADGRPAGGARVVIRTQHPLGGGEPNVAFGITHSDGTIELPALVGADGTLTASRAGFGAVVVAVQVAESRVAPPLVLLPEGRVEVRVQAPRDVDPACRLLFEMTTPVRARVDAPLADDEVWTTRPDERFDHVSVYRGLAPGRVVAIAQGRGWRLEAPVMILAGETAVVTLGSE